MGSTKLSGNVKSRVLIVATTTAIMQISQKLKILLTCRHIIVSEGSITFDKVSLLLGENLAFM